MGAVQKRIEKKSSRTAAYTCMCRASSYLEKDKYFRSDDHIAVELLPRFIKLLLKSKILDLKGRISPKGIYPYVIARTKYIDEIFKNSLKNGVEQIVIMGSGFDSRAIRLTGRKSLVQVFEIDSRHTQIEKAGQLKKRNIPVPDHNVYIPLDFDREDLRTKLMDYGFRKGSRSLFILEGLIMYLKKEAVIDLFKLIMEYSSSSSLVVFDYLYSSVLRGELKFYGEKEIIRKVTKVGERWSFGIEEGEIENFLNNLNFNLIECLDFREMENRYFTDKTRGLVARINGTHGIVLAETGDS